MDDMVLWHDDKAVLKQALKSINDFVIEKLNCSLKPLLLNYSTCGLPFLGYRLKPNTIKLTLQSKKRFIRKMAIVEDKYQTQAWSETHCQRHALPLLAFVQHANTEGVRKSVLD